MTGFLFFSKNEMTIITSNPSNKFPSIFSQLIQLVFKRIITIRDFILICPARIARWRCFHNQIAEVKNRKSDYGHNPDCNNFFVEHTLKLIILIPSLASQKDNYD